MHTLHPWLGRAALAFGLVGSLAAAGCEDRSDDAVAPYSSGSVDFSNYIAIGNSITAGFMSNAQTGSDQIYAYPNLIAQAAGQPRLRQPLIKDPGFQPNATATGAFVTGRIELRGFDASGTPILVAPNQGAFNPATLAGYLVSPPPALSGTFYQDLGVPGAKLADVLAPTAAYASNPFFALNASNPLAPVSQLAVAQTVSPTLVTVWIGNNDVLGFATSGGASPTAPTSSSAFASDYAKLMNKLDSVSTNPKVIVANIPDVTSIPFFTTVGATFKAALANVPVDTIYYQNPTATNPLATAKLAKSDIGSTSKGLILLTASTYLGKAGQPTGAYWRDVAKSRGIPVGALLGSFGGAVDTTKPFIFDPRNPLPNSLILSATEITTAKAAVTAFNNTILTEATKHGFPVVDVNALLNRATTVGVNEGGLTFNTAFLTGGLFSYDGVHPNARAHGLIANEFIRTINRSFGANLPFVDLSTLPASPIRPTGTTATKLGMPSFGIGLIDGPAYR